MCLIFRGTWLQRLDYIIFPFWGAFWRCSSSTLKKIVSKNHSKVSLKKKKLLTPNKMLFLWKSSKSSVFDIVLLMMVQHLTAVIPTIMFWTLKEYIVSFLVTDWFIYFQPHVTTYSIYRAFLLISKLISLFFKTDRTILGSSLKVSIIALLSQE